MDNKEITTSRPGTLRQACKELGIRMTRQREAVIDLLDNAEGHLDARTLLAEAKRRVPDIDKTTIYRTIRRLRELKLIDELDLLHLNHEGHYYEPLPGKMHMHIVCVECGRVNELKPVAWESVETEIQEALGFCIETARIEIGGVCSGCRKRRVSQEDLQSKTLD